jgi:hypothetical protein
MHLSWFHVNQTPEDSVRFPGTWRLESRRRSYARDYDPDMKVLSLDGNSTLSLLAFARRQSLDARLREALKPMVSEADILRQDQFDQLCQDTHLALRTRLDANEDSDEVRTALLELIKLLEENLALRATLEVNLNRVKKV